MRKFTHNNNLNLLIVLMCGWFLLSTYGLTHQQSFDNSSQQQQRQLLSNGILEVPPKRFTFGNSILGNSFNKDKNITNLSHQLFSIAPAPAPAPALAVDASVWPLKKYYRSAGTYTDDESIQHSTDDADVDADADAGGKVKIHNNFHYGINKSNQENISYNNEKQKPATPSQSNSKVVNSSGTSIATAAEATAAEATATATSSKTSSSKMMASESALDATNSTSSPSSSSSSTSSFFERVELKESLTHRKSEKLLLHRNKRYLLFPEGSSFQLVFDLIIPIVDYTNFAIMGITCAVAWELPSKPPSEIIENFRTKLNDGTFGLIRRNDSTQQSLVFINSPRTEQDDVANNKRWEEDIAQTNANVYNENYQLKQQQRLSATVATTSGHQNFITNALKSPTLSTNPTESAAQPSTSNFYYNSNGIQSERFPQPTATTSFYSKDLEQKKWSDYNNNFKTFDANQRKTFYASNNNNNNNNRRRQIYQKNDFAFSQPNNYYNNYNYNSNNNKYKTYTTTANEWNVENWQTKNKYQKPYQQYSPLTYPQTHVQQQKQPQHTKIPYNDAGDYWNKDNCQQNYQTPMFSRRTGRNRKILDKPPKHRVYPVFGKRRRRRSSTLLRDDELAKKLLDIHTREHLQTRQKLYGKIEKLYKTRGQNGTACVLRALCETEKMHLNDHYREAPQSFVMELLRSIFALPKETLTNSKESLLPLDTRYTDAVLLAHDNTQSCSQQYFDCEYSITNGI
ncbi:hypothetical protein DOY81_006257 [Sarcophaga bullata]|nr:hypothetical protein DOY81_006257 [Sarcophaga bullata]